MLAPWERPSHAGLVPFPGLVQLRLPVLGAAAATSSTRTPWKASRTTHAPDVATLALKCTAHIYCTLRTQRRGPFDTPARVTTLVVQALT